MKNFAKYHLPAILYAILIITLSSMSSLHLPRVRNIQLDKIIHFVEYAVFAMLVFRSFSHFSRRISAGLVFLLGLLFMTIFALSDELHQRFVPGRQADPFDLLSDILGSFLVLAYLWWRRRGALSRNANRQ